MSDSRQDDWRPTASWATLQQRARALAAIRTFFAARGLLEVETPALLQHAVTDPQLHNLPVRHGNRRTLFLHTSPEFHMKRLLAAGAPDIWQLARVYRDGEVGRHHEPEFALIEWYRHGFSLRQLADESCALVEHLAQALPATAAVPRSPPVHWRYQQLFQDALALDPLAASAAELEDCARALLGERCALPPGVGDSDATLWLDLLMTHVVQPRLASTFLAVVSGYPASQAAWARLDPVDARVAERFEVYLCGIEVANGYHELTDPAEHRRRLAADRGARTRLGLPDVVPDSHFLAAIDHGLPDCAGVAVGLDRVLMVLAGLPDLRSVVAFPVL